LVVGGNRGANSAELYDPTIGTWSVTGSPNVARLYQHTATLLQSGKVLVAGGFNNCSNSCSILNRAELYDPVSGTWSVTGNLNTARRAFTATLLSNGKVLVAGGYNDVSGDLRSAELYDPSTGRWIVTGNLITPRGIPTATLLLNGKVLVAGGEGQAINSRDATAQRVSCRRGHGSERGPVRSVCRNLEYHSLPQCTSRSSHCDAAA